MVPLSKISDVICGPFGSAIKNTDYQEEGLPLIRITNITKNGYMNYDDIIYITEELGNSLSRSQVVPGDIVISQRGSLGQCAIVDDKFNKLNISANIIAVKNIHNSSAQFIHDYFLSIIGQTLLERNVSGQVQPKITTQDIADLLIPVNCDERKLCQIVVDGYNTYKQKLNQADKLVEKTKKAVFEQLGISFEKYHPSLYSVSSLRELKEIGIYCNPHSAYLEKIFEIFRHNPYYVGELEHFVDVNPSINRGELQDDDLVTFVPMPAVTEKVNIVEYETKKYHEVKTGFTPFQKGDLLWAKITPCMQNGKSFYADNMPTKYGFGSTEFHVLRTESERVYLPFLWVLFSEEHILEAAQGMFSGSAGQQRVPDVFLKKFPLILPPKDIQIELADRVFDALNQSKQLRLEAEQEWQEAKAQFEKELLGE